MSKEIYISTTPHETRLAIVEDEQLAEIYFERENEYTLAGSIYNGRVTRVLPGMQSSFVDLGLERDAFLYVTDFMEEQGDAADFETGDGGSRRGSRESGSREQSGRDLGSREAGSREAGSREAAPREGGARDDSRAGRGRGGRRERGRNRPETTEEETQSFDEPIAPAPIEASAATGLEADAEGSSRRWRGRRGRRRGRGAGGENVAADGASESGTDRAEQQFPTSGGETIVIEGSADDDETGSPIEIDLSGEAEVFEQPEYRAPRHRPGRDRGERGREDRAAREERSRGVAAPEAGSYGNASYGQDAVPSSGPALLPGESIRKYRDPAEVAAEDAARRASQPKIEPLVAASAPSIEVVGWDGGAVLPGETLSRHRGREPKGASLRPADVRAYRTPSELVPFAPAVAEQHVDPTPIPDIAEIAPAEAAEETGGLTQHPAHGDESAAVTPTDAPAVTGEPVEVATIVAAAEADAPVPTAGEYEPADGESATLGDTARRDYRHHEPAMETSGEPSAEEEAADPEIVAPTPDATTYDLQPETQGTATASTLEAPLAEHEYTTLAPTGDMLSEAPLDVADDAHELPPVQDQTPTPMDAAGEGHSVATHVEAVSFAPSLDEVETETILDGEETPIAEVHAYGDGDLEEEELDGEEFEYDAALSLLDDDESEEYEEETLDGDADLVYEMSQDERAGREEADEADEEETAADSLAGGFSVDDFGGEPDEQDEEGSAGAPAAEQGGGQERRGRRDGRERQDGRRAGRGRGERSFRGGAGGDRGRGRGRQSVQTMDLPAINDLLKPGQEVLVQIAKEPIAKKGARITSHIALPGRFLVFMPTVNHTGVSRKISSDEERRRLKTILLSEKGDAQGGFIVRTAADGASEEELRNDLRFLIQLWADIKTRSETSKSPALIYHDLGLIERILRDQVTDNFSAIWVDTEQEYERVLRFLQRFQPSLVRRVKLYTKETPLFEHFSLTQEIDKALKSKVWLKSGGSIVINQTEALVAIDINTGKYVGKTARLEDTIVKTNLDAIPEIVRQIRLRDLGGIIVIDFIDMDDRKNRAKVLQVLEDELRSDRAPSKVLPFNDFGLVIMTRKRVKQSLERTLCVPDPITEGTGMIKSPITVANEIYVEMRKMHRHLEKSDVMLRVHPEVVKQLKSNGGKRLQELEEMTRKTILVKSDPALNPEQFDIH